MRKKELEVLVFNKLVEFIQKTTTTNRVQHLKGGLQIRTEPPVQTTKWGRKKFQYGIQTVWLSLDLPNGKVNLARLTEPDDYEVLDLHTHRKAIEENMKSFI